jgi:twitching motility protein PilT
MAKDCSVDERVYMMNDSSSLSMRDLLDYFLKVGALRVSDLHIKVNAAPTYRVDGSLQRLKGWPLTKEAMEKLAFSVLSDFDVKTLDEKRSVDSSYLFEQLQFRINCFHDNDGLAMAVRALGAKVPEVEDIGFPNDVWQDIVARQHGLVLVTGITGAGKSTTIASLVSRISRQRPCRIITLEDPVEYRLPGGAGMISQREVGRDVFSFERGLRDCLREDPDVIFVGEMRDRESTAWTLTAAETGHLVFSTLHTRDTRGSITRLLDMFPPTQHDEIANQLSLGLAYVLSQKLVPRADGKGRAVAMEVLNNNYAVSNLIRTGKIEQLYTQLQTKIRDIPEERMMTMERSLAHLVKQGLVAPFEAQKWANDPQTFMDAMQQLSQAA